MTNEKRTIAPQIAAPGGQPDLPGMPPQGWGVGNDPTPCSQVGGGYLSICMPSEFRIPGGKKKFSDPRISELEIMGMNQTFLDVAEAIGFEAFMTMWKIFDADPALQDQGPSAMRIIMQPYRSWKRFQRNRYVEQLFAAGLSDDEVQRRLEKQLATEISGPHVRRLRRESAGRDKPRNNHVARRGKKR